MIAGLGGDTGKTSVSVGLCRFWKTTDYRVIPYKKGPDYIDMAWLAGRRSILVIMSTSSS